jgi:hypothetical protein
VVPAGGDWGTLGDWAWAAGRSARPELHRFAKQLLARKSDCDRVGLNAGFE